jgi:hypothetical protein
VWFSVFKFIVCFGGELQRVNKQQLGAEELVRVEDQEGNTLIEVAAQVM